MTQEEMQERIKGAIEEYMTNHEKKGTRGKKRKNGRGKRKKEKGSD